MFSNLLPLIILGGLMALPLVLGLVMRVSASHLFFSVMAGDLLVHYFGDSAKLVLFTLTRNQTVASYSGAILLSIPLILTAIFLKRTLSRGKTFLHVIPLAITGVVYAIFILPGLPVQAQDLIRSNPRADQFISLNSVFIGIVIFFQLIALWILNRGGERHRRRK